jgi:predicted HicB family RNase H-like nuclease
MSRKISVRLPDSLYENLENRAKEEKLSFTEVVVATLKGGPVERSKKTKKKEGKR